MALPLSVVPIGPLPIRTQFPDVKDPSPVYDGRRWHLFGTGCGDPRGLQLLHAVADDVGGPWTEVEPARLEGVDHITSPAAPGVVAEDGVLHMFLQHDFNVLGGHIEHLVSDDGGATFALRGTALQSVAGTGEAGVYDPDPALVDGERYLTYSGMSVVGQPDLYLARSTGPGWDGPWERVGCILDHEQVTCHNQLDDEDYEWGLEGPQLVALPDGRCLLTAVCFLAGHPAGSRQRVLLAVADGPEGPYEVLGPLVEPGTDLGENGHGSAVVADGVVHLIYQERAGEGRPWHYRRAILAPAA